MSDTNEELKPCPFCGGEAIITRVGKMSTQDGINLYIYPVYNANHEIVKYELYSDDCTKPIRKWNYVGNIVVEEEINDGK